MTNRLKALLIGLACLVCCIPLVIGIIGAATGISGATALWFRRYDLAILAIIGLTGLVLATEHHRPEPDHPNHGGEE